MTEQQQKLYDKLLKKVNEYCLGYAAEDVIAAIDDLVESYDVKSGLEYLQSRYTLKRQSAPLQALENIIETFIDKDSEDIKTVRTALRALEILKRNCILAQYPDGSYELAFPIKIQPRDEDVEVLKETLK